jgi:HD superfamily phosphohydrolase
MSNVSGTTIIDPIYGYIDIEANEQRIINSRAFQRLRFIKQVPFGNIVYPGANQTAHEHAIGTMHIASRIISEIDQRPSVVRMMRIAALLHNIDHAPFSHAFDTFVREKHLVRDQWSHYDFMRSRIILETEIGDLLKAADCSPREIMEILEGRENRSILSQILSSPINADGIDYILRDSYHIGLPRVIDVEALVRSYVKYELNSRDYLAHRIEAINALEDFLLNKYRLYNLVHLHKDIRCAEIMMSEAMSAAEDELHLGESLRNPEHFLKLTDSSLMTHMLELVSTSSSARRAIDLAGRVARNDLLPLAFETNLATGIRSGALDGLMEMLGRGFDSRATKAYISSMVHVGQDQLFVDLESPVYEEHIPLEPKEGKIRYLDEVSSTSRQIFPIRYLRVYTYPSLVRQVAEALSSLFRSE